MKRNPTFAEKKVMPSKTPWEDALILAFRDMQWIRKIRGATSTDLTALAEPPSLFAKLDGNAETASGDVLTGYRGRFFLLEFKASKSHFGREKTNKLVYAVLTKPELAKECRDQSMRGHFVVYPEVKNGHDQGNKAILPIHSVVLMCMPYLGMAKCDHIQELITAKLDTVYYDGNQGLDLVEMGCYLASLVSMAAEDGGEGTPIKAVIASSDGMFWPVGDLSDLEQFIRALEQSSRAFQLRNGIQHMKKAIQQSKLEHASNFKSDNNSTPSI